MHVRDTRDRYGPTPVPPRTRTVSTMRVINASKAEKHNKRMYALIVVFLNLAGRRRMAATVTMAGSAAAGSQHVYIAYTHKTDRRTQRCRLCTRILSHIHHAEVFLFISSFCRFTLARLLCCLAALLVCPSLPLP